MAVDIAPDGSPVLLYQRLPSRDADAALVDKLLAGPGTVLDLGCGTGRIAEPLARLGHRVTGVDNEPAMLAALRAATGVRADVATVRLSERYDAVLLLSHFVNTADERFVAAAMDTASQHVTPAGFVIVERYPPGWVSTCTESSRTVAGVRISMSDIARTGEVMAATMRYEWDGLRADQRFAARDVSDDQLAVLAATVGLQFVSTLNDAGTLALLRPS